MGDLHIEYVSKDQLKPYANNAKLHTDEQIEQIGTGAIRAPRQFGRTRKVVKTHQNVLVMYKGDPKNIKTNFPDLSEYDREISDGWNTVV